MGHLCPYSHCNTGEDHKCSSDTSAPPPLSSLHSASLTYNIRGRRYGELSHLNCPKVITWKKEMKGRIHLHPFFLPSFCPSVQLNPYLISSVDKFAQEETDSSSLWNPDVRGFPLFCLATRLMVFPGPDTTDINKWRPFYRVFLEKQGTNNPCIFHWEIDVRSPEEIPCLSFFLCLPGILFGLALQFCSLPSHSLPPLKYRFVW